MAHITKGQWLDEVPDWSWHGPDVNSMMVMFRSTNWYNEHIEEITAWAERENIMHNQDPTTKGIFKLHTQAQKTYFQLRWG